MAWLEVQANVPMPVRLHVRRADDGRHIITALTIGDESSDDEITSQTLRAIRLREIMSEAFDSYVFAAPLGSPVDNARATTPDAHLLKAFARTYLTELTRQPQRAMTASAKVHGISRATANRWAERCREFGYLPAKPLPEDRRDD